jgi:hypothetical protein
VPSRPLLALVAAALGLALVASAPGPGPRVVDVVTVRPDATSASNAAPATTTTTGYAGADPASWTIRRLAAQLVFSCVDLSDLGDRGAAQRQAAAGIGGITLLGSHPPRHLRGRLAAVRRSAGRGEMGFVESGVEGGGVQRLGEL